MRVVIRGETVDFVATNVILENNPNEPDRLTPFHCTRCGHFLIQFKGNMVYIMPGNLSSALPLVIRCDICKNKYIIHSIV